MDLLKSMEKNRLIFLMITIVIVKKYFNELALRKICEYYYTKDSM